MTGDADDLAGAHSALREIEAACAQVRTSLAAERYVEAQGWVGSVQDAVESLDDTVGMLAAGERNRVLGEEAVSTPNNTVKTSGNEATDDRDL